MTFRVVIADDSPGARMFLAALIASDPRFEIVGLAGDGEEAVAMAMELRPDLMTIDLGMPRLDGVGATERIMSAAPCPIVVISGESSGEAATGFRALAAGALEILRKPDGLDTTAFLRLGRVWTQTLALMAEIKVVRRRGRVAPVSPFTPSRTSIVGICASTGGPPALEAILRTLPTSIPISVVIVQHIARGFAPNLVEWLGSTSAIPVRLASDGMALEPGCAYVAPDDRHLLVGRKAISLSDAAPVRHHRPSGDLLFSSLARSWGSAAAGVILTGMGSDGSNGLRELSAAGGRVIAQTESSCAIASMPLAAIEAGIANDVLPIEEIPAWLVQLATEGTRNA